MASNRWLALAALTAVGWATFQRTARRRLARPRAEPEHLQTWEGEGGAVPVGGSRIAAAQPPKSEDLREGGAAGPHAPPLSIGTR